MRGFVVTLAVFLGVLEGALASDAMELRRELDRAYGAWRRAMMAKSYPEWQQTTASYRQMLTRNLIVSQKQPFPAALFAVPMHPPETAPLRFLSARLKGDTASLIYFGKVDLGVADMVEIPENLLVLRFIKEHGVWKFDTTQLMHLEGAPEVRSAFRNGAGEAYLNRPALMPSGVAPPVALACPTPDRVGVLQIASFGYEAKAQVNGFEVATVKDNAEEHIIIGGLREGMNALSLSLKRAPLPEDVAETERVIAVNALVLTGSRRRPSIRVFEWKPEHNPEDGVQNLVIHVSRITMREQP